MKAINPAQYLPFGRDTQERRLREYQEPTATEEDVVVCGTQEQEHEETATEAGAIRPDHEITAIALEEPGEPIVYDDILDDDEEHEGKAFHFPEASRFESPRRQQQSSPMKPDINPLGHLRGMGTGTGVSLADVFNTPSSPVDRMRVMGSLPPTPSYAAARLMAQSLPSAPGIWNGSSSPVWPTSPDWRRGTTEPPECSRPSEIDQNRGLAKEPSKTPVRPRTLSPVPFSSPAPLLGARPMPKVVLGDEDLFSNEELRKMKADERKRKAEAAIKAYRPSESGTLSAKRVKRPGRPARGSGKSVDRKTVERSVVELVDDDETASDTGPESQSRDDCEIFATAAAARPCPVVPQTQVPASPPIARPAPRTQPRTILELDETWEQLHQVTTLQRRSKSYNSLRRRPDPPESALHHTKSLPNISAPQLEGRGTSTNPISLTQMVPFNVPDFPPTPPDPESTDATPEIPREVPGFVRESSGLVPLASQTQIHLTPGLSSPVHETRASLPPATHGSNEKVSAMPTAITESDSVHLPRRMSPGRVLVRHTTPNEVGTRTKRRREMDGGDDGLTVSSAEAHQPLKSFAAMNDSQPPLSSLEEPDEVDMIGIIRDVGIGYRPDLEVPEAPPPIPKNRARKKRKISSRLAEAVEPVEPVVQIRFSDPQSPHPAAFKTTSAANFTGKATPAADPPSKPNTKIRGTSTRTRPAPTIFPKLGLDSPTLMVTTEDESEVPVANVLTAQESSSTDPPIIAPRRVFALFKDQKLHYYPATLCPTESQSRVQVVFDDGTPCQLERQCVRSLDLRIGDTVRVDMLDMKRGTWTISSFPEPSPATELDKYSDGDAVRHSDIRGHVTVFVTAKNASISGIEVPLTKIYLTKSLWAQYGPRDISTNASLPMPVSNSLHAASSPSIFPGLITTSIRRTSTPAFMDNSPIATTKAGLFQGMVFTLSFGPEDIAKRSIERKIRMHGGRLLQSGFDELFYDVDAMSDPAHHPMGNGNRQQLVMKAEVRDLGFTAVIAPVHSRRAKFLQALALGLPCLANRWIDDCIKKGKILDWQHYLLPAGESRYLGGALRSRTLPLSDAAITRLGDIYGRQTIFDGWKVIAVEKGLGAEKRVFHLLSASLESPANPSVENVYVPLPRAWCEQGCHVQNAGCS